MLTRQPLKVFKYNRYQSNKYDDIINITKKLFQGTMAPTPKTDKIIEYMKINNNKMDLGTEFDIDNLQKLEIRRYNTDRRINICPKILLPASIVVLYTGFDEITFGILLGFVCYYWFQLLLRADKDDDINKLCSKIVNKFNKTE